MERLKDGGMEKRKLKDRTREELNAMSPDEFRKAVESEKLFTVRDAIAWLSKQDPDAGLMYYEVNSNAWCDMSPDMFTTARDERERELKYQRSWWASSKDRDEKARKEVEEIFRYVDDGDICVRA